MRRTRSGWGAAWLAVALWALCDGRAQASDLSASGQLVYAPDALAAIDFENSTALIDAGISFVDWTAGATPTLDTTALDADQISRLFTDGPAALDGHHALKLQAATHSAIALRDATLLDAQVGNRLSVSMWGRAFGAEPVLELVYAHNTTNVGPGRVSVTAIRTGRETSDGWVEYSTGPVDGGSWTASLRAIVLTARYATDTGANTLIDEVFSPANPAPPTIIDPTGYAVVDAVEVRPASGPAMSPNPCTQSSVDAACGSNGACVYGHCVDAALVWGPVPSPVAQRNDLVARWAFLMQSLIGDRLAATHASTLFAGAAATLSASTSPRGFYEGLHELIVGVRDSHTFVGVPPSTNSVLYPFAGDGSGALDACFGLAQNDLGGGETVYAVFAVDTHPTTPQTLAPGDILTTVDGMTTSDWLALVAPRFATNLPNDPTADPSRLALILSSLLERYATTVTFSRCSAGGGCVAQPPIAVSDAIYAAIVATGTFTGNTQVCTLRFSPSVASPPPDGASIDTVVEETVGPVTSVQFDGFEAVYDGSAANPYAAWEDPFTAAFSAGTPLLIDARVGFGGSYTLGEWLYQQIRASSDPYGMVALPRAAYDDADPPWLFAQSWNACDYTTFVCQWSGGQVSFAGVAAPPAATTKVAWVNGDDVSMNDITPRLLAGRASFRVFGPHPSRGAYGEISKLPPIGAAWGVGSMQVLDSRFGTTPATAIAAPWESGKGVVPDQVVLQKVSDILAGNDTVLLAAKAWLSQ